jgi:hypothetical protein
MATWICLMGICGGACESAPLSPGYDAKIGDDPDADLSFLRR